MWLLHPCHMPCVVTTVCSLPYQICVTLLAAVGGISAAPRSDPQLSISDLTGKGLFEFGNDNHIDSGSFGHNADNSPHMRYKRSPVLPLVKKPKPFLLPIPLPIPIGWLDGRLSGYPVSLWIKSLFKFLSICYSCGHQSPILKPRVHLGVRVFVQIQTTSIPNTNILVL